jgi:cohesin loading factor subunit SCC2
MTKSLFNTDEERHRARAQLQQLNTEACNPHSTSHLLEQSLRKLQDLLHPQGLTQYNFKPLPGWLTHRGASNQANGDAKGATPSLTAVTKMAVDQSDISFAYPSPEVSPKRAKRLSGQRHSAQTRTPQNRQHHESPPKISLKQDANGATPASSARTQNMMNYQLNVGISSTPPTCAKQIKGPTVVITNAPSASSQHLYQAVDDSLLSKQSTPSKKRKRDNIDLNLNFSIDQQQKATAALNLVNEVIDDLFEAEENFEPGKGDDLNIFVQDATGPNDKPILTRVVQARLDSAIQKASSAAAFASIALERLIGLQKLCEPSVSAVETYNLAIGDDPSDGDTEEWLQQLDLAEGGLQVSRIILRIMSAGREEKRLYSEDLLTAILQALQHTMDTVIIPVVESRSTGRTADIFKVYSAQRKSLNSLLQMFGKVLRVLGDLAARVEIADSAITKVEYLAIGLIYVENSYSEKDSCLGVQRFENTRRIAMDVLTKLFGRYSEQRTFIFNEILASLEKLPVTRQSARQFKVVDGKPIQLVSALLMRLVQASATKSIVKSALSKATSNGDSMDQHNEEDEASDSSSESEHVSPKKRSNTLTEGESDDVASELRNVAEPLARASLMASSHVTNFLVQRALTSTKSGDQPYRNLLDIFTEDFLNVLGLPDWPAAEILLRTLLTKCLQIADDDKQLVPARNMALDLMGLLGSGISDLQIWARNAARSVDPSQSQVTQGLYEYASQLLDDGINEYDAIRFDGPYRIVLEYIHSQGLNDPQQQSARGCFLTLWAKACTTLVDSAGGPELSKKLLLNIRNMIGDPNWLPTMQ